MVGSVWGTIPTILYTLENPLIAGGVVLGGVLLGIGGWQAAKRFGWRRGPSVAAGISLGVVLGATFSRTLPDYASMPGVVPRERPFCYVNGFSAVGGNEMINVLLFVPLVFFAVLAVRRVLVVAGAAVALSAVVELLQPLTHRGLCETQDFLNNSAGSLVAAAAGAAVLALGRVASR
ncbi:VanZ family protein [Umezawaea tangerina]|uniref:VanZ like protein n=1 Tax=Umezawaea tangerina TaxID=84725 RepID=A0A2T0TG76_9PSEU|nr:VanZ family protein [Umezawaea tangerina]PRY44692.1 VanZ like protein [Umezawaea tangerina]